MTFKLTFAAVVLALLILTFHATGFEIVVRTGC